MVGLAFFREGEDRCPGWLPEPAVLSDLDGSANALPLFGEHHDWWNCQSAVVKSGLVGGSSGLSAELRSSQAKSVSGACKFRLAHVLSNTARQRVCLPVDAVSGGCPGGLRWYE